MSLNDVIKEIEKYPIESNIVFTGGEPLLQQQDITYIIKKMEATNYLRAYEIETNGSIKPNWYLLNKCDFNVAYKLSNSGNKPYELKVLPMINTIYKFVTRGDSKEMKEIVKTINKYNIPARNVYLMTQGATRREQIKYSPKVIELCKIYGFNFSPRVHILIYDKRRGV
jgi:6-pyruvoyltetrahydropterin 2'-reductase